MGRSLVTTKPVKPPKELAWFFDDPPLVGNETTEHYESVFFAIAQAAHPSDGIAWLFVKDITDLAWETRRERMVKTQIIKSSQMEVVSRLMDKSGFYLAMAGISEDGLRWSSDANARQQIDQELAKRGHGEISIMAMAYESAADQIDVVDRRIASYELRRISIVKEASLYNEKLARRLDQVSSDIIDGEFSEAAE
jgi:hypothetical protein